MSSDEIMWLAGVRNAKTKWDTYRISAEKAQAAGNHAEAEAMWIAALEEAQYFEESDSRLPLTLERLGECYFNQGKYNDAEPLARRLLQIYESTLGPDHSDVGVAAANLARLYHWQHKFGQSEPLYKKALTIKTKALGPNHPEVTQVLENIAHLLQMTHREEEAAHLKVCIRGITTGRWESSGRFQTLKSQDKKPSPAEVVPEKELASDSGSKHVSVGAASSSGQSDLQQARILAEAFMQEGRYDEAEEHWKSALQHAESSGFGDHRLTACLDGLASALLKQQKGHLSEPLLKRSLQIKLDALGPMHLVVGAAYNTLAELHYMQGHYAEAEMYGKKCLKVYESACGPDHVDTARCLYNLATLNHVQGNYNEAEPYYTRSLKIREKALGHNHPETIKTTKNYLNLLKTVRREDKMPSAKADDSDPGYITGSWKAVSLPPEQSLVDKKE